MVCLWYRKAIKLQYRCLEEVLRGVRAACGIAIQRVTKQKDLCNTGRCIYRQFAINKPTIMLVCFSRDLYSAHLNGALNICLYHSAGQSQNPQYKLQTILKIQVK